MKHETHLSTEQTEAKEKIRVSRSHEDGRRPQSDPKAPARRPQGSFRLTKADRLLKRYEFLAVGRKRDRLVGKFLCIDRRKARSTRLGITASGRYGNSPERNRFKRLVREAFRRSRSSLPTNLEINVFPRQMAKEATMSHIQEELLRLLGKSNVAIK